MLINLRMHGDLVLSEWLQFRLASRLGRSRAQEKMAALLSDPLHNGETLHDRALNDQELSSILDGEEFSFMKHPEKYTGLSENIVNDLLRELHEQRNQDPKEL